MKKNFSHFMLSSIFLTSAVAANEGNVFSFSPSSFSPEKELHSSHPTSHIRPSEGIVFSLPTFDFSTEKAPYSPPPAFNIMREEKPDINSIRLGKILSDRPQERAIPKLTTPYKVLDFIHAIFNGEQQFWQDTQATFRESNERLNTIISIVENAIRRLPKNASKIDIINAKYSTELQLHSKCRREDSDNHEIYKSYQESINYYEGINSLLLDLEKKENINIETIKESINSFIKDKKNTFKTKKKLRTTSGVKSINDDLKKSIDYYSCDLDQLIYSSEETINDVFSSFIKEQEIFLTPKKSKKPKKKKKSQRKLFSMSLQSDSSPKETAEAVLPLNVLADLTLNDMPSDDKALELTSAPLIISDSLLQNQAEKNDSLEVNPNMRTAEIAEEEIDLAPWKKYEKKEITEKNTSVKNLITPSVKELKIDFNIKETILSFFSTEQKYVTQNVAMKDFIEVLEKKFDGHVYRGNEQLHFMGKHPETQKWHSVCMHVLHKDNKTHIPRNTLYWSRAKNLLIQLEARNLIDKEPNQPPLS